MSEEKKESRVNIEDLPQAEQELTPEEAQEVQGGLSAGTYGRGTYQLFLNDGAAVNNDGKGEIITGAGPGTMPHVK